MIADLPFINPVRDWIDRNQSLLLKILIPLAVLAASYIVGKRPTPLLLAPLPLLAGLVIFSRKPELGFPVIIAAGLLVPFSVGTGTGSSLNAPMLAVGGLAGLWILRLVTGQDPLPRLHRATTIPLVALLIVATIAFIAGRLPWFRFVAAASTAAQAGGLALFFLSALAFIWVGHQVRDIRWLEAATWTFLALGGLYIIGRAVPQLQFIAREFPKGVGAGSLFWVWMMAMSVSQVVFNKRLSVPARLALAALVLLTVYVAFVQTQDWKSGWVPPLFTIVALGFFYAPVLGVIAGIVSIFPALAFVNQLIATDVYSFSTRVDAWLILLEIIRVNPVLGLGPSNYYFYTPLYSIRGYSVSFNSHNQYVDLVAQIGVLGLICFLWFFAQVTLLGWRLRLHVPEGFPRAYVFGALAGLGGTLLSGMLGDWIVPFVYNVGFEGFRVSMLGWLFLGGLVSLAAIYGEPGAAE